MAGWNTYFLVKLMTVWNYLNTVYSNTKNKCQNMYFYLKDYFNGHHDIWLFVPGHTLPLSLNNLNNTVNINWLYNNYDNTFTFSNNTTNNIRCKFSWLSAKIQVTDRLNPERKNEYLMDDFIEKFTLCTNSNTTPSLYMVFMCWCAHTKHWFKMDDNIEFHIIDDMGEEHNLNIHINNKNSIIIKRNRLYVVSHTEDENHIETDNTILNPATPLKGEKDE